jgi:1-phosphatidylinositol-4-phosphate 5-kinase
MLHRQIQMDCTFLETQGIMDYSLLLGVHFRNDLSLSKIGLSQPIALTSKLEKRVSFSS